jgi:hypothetical protein
MTDVYFSDQICYLNDINKASATCYGILNAVNIYKKTFLYNYYPQIADETAKVQAALNAEMHITHPHFPPTPYKFQLLRENIVDNFLIGTFFEIVAKAFVLERGYLVHKINGRRPPESLRQLSASQRQVPVKVDDYLKYDGFDDYRGVGRNGLKHLSFSTVDYKNLYENGYREVLPFSDNFINDATIFRSLRNQIHFPLAGASESIMELGQSSGDTHQVIMGELEATIKPLFDKLKDQHDLVYLAALEY